MMADHKNKDEVNNGNNCALNIKAAAAAQSVYVNA
jgi:hypothetical protein